MKILFVTYGTQKAPATRYRVTQYLPHLKHAGLSYTVFSAISGFSTNLMINSPDYQPLARFIYYAYVFIERSVRLLGVIFISRRYDIIFLQRTTFPLRLELLLKAINKNIIFDIDDAIYLPDNQGNDLLTCLKKYIKEKEVINILRVSKIVIVENEYIKEFVLQYCKNIVKIPGPIDTDRYFVKKKENKNDITIGWIGSPATTLYLHMMDSIFKAVQKKYSVVKFNFIGLGKYEAPDIRFERIPWHYEKEVKGLQAFDIGLMPMPDDEWTRGKLGCKMLQYMAVGIPAVVSYTPTNAEIIEDGINGFFAKNDDEWIEILSRLIEDSKLRNSIGLKGRETVLARCSLSANIKKYIDIFNALPKKGT